MIGRNGHQLWPEALEIVHEFWRQLPERYRYNRALKRYEELYENWDCSLESFEGIRAQDILPLLLEYFHFQLFVGCGNVIDPLPSYTEGTRVWSVSKSDGSQTFYVKYGDWFAWSCTIVTIVLFIMSFRRRASEITDN